MTVIFSRGNLFWIEVFNIPRQTVLASSSVTIVNTLEHAGRFIGCSIVFDGTFNRISGRDLSNLVQNTDATEITEGQSLEAFNVIFHNQHSSIAQSLGAHVIVLMRGKG